MGNFGCSRMLFHRWFSNSSHHYHWFYPYAFTPVDSCNAGGHFLLGYYLRNGWNGGYLGMARTPLDCNSGYRACCIHRLSGSSSFNSAQNKKVITLTREEFPWYQNLLLDPERWEECGLYLKTPQLRIGYEPGVMPGKWFSRWHDRYDALTPLLELPLAEAKGLAALTALDPSSEDENQPLAHMALLRPEAEPEALDKDRFHCIPLYREQRVVVMPKDHLLTVLDEVPLEEFAEEFLLQEPETAPEWAEVSAEYRAAHPQKLPEMRHTQDAVELVAAGLGLLIVPMSIARFYHRKDLTYRPVAGMSESLVALVWERKTYSEEFEQVLQDFIGICRGRTESSDRGTDSKQTELEKAKRDKEKAKAKARAKNARREQADRKKRNAQKNGNARQHARQTSKKGKR